jgi:hypothetical protein
MNGSYGVMAEFATADSLLEAAHAVRARGYRAVEAYAPFPVAGLAEAVGFERNRVPLIVLLGGIIGGVGGFFMQWYAAVISYPFNLGGRPANSWPAFIPVTFEMTILGAALAGFFGMLLLNGLPRLIHPVFGAPCFQLATRDRFFLCIRADDPGFSDLNVRELLGELEPLSVHEVPR